MTGADEMAGILASMHPQFRLGHAAAKGEAEATITILTADLADARARLRALEAAAEQAIGCIMDETPEDMSREDARADTLAKLRGALKP
jgi:hypothetical protein